MFRARSSETEKSYRLAIVALLTLSVAALAVTIWVMIDFLREQEIVGELIGQLPPTAAESAEELAGELRWQFRLSILVVLNLVVTGFAVVLLWRAYRSSQESLRDVKALASDILSSMEQAVLTTDLDGNITGINRRAMELLGAKDEDVGQPLEQISESVPLEQFRREANAAQPVHLTRDYSLAGGVGRTLRAFCQPLRDRENAFVGNIFQVRDVSERVLMDDRMRRMERYMGLGSLAAGLHHEIKNPLAALSLHVQLLEEELDSESLSDEAAEMLGVIKAEVSRVGGVLESFRDFASIGQLNLSPLDLEALIGRQVKLITPQADQQRIDIRVDLRPTLPAVSADRVRLEQVLLNLFVNAMDAMPTGGVLSVRARTAGSNGERVQVEVMDTGAGIPENLRSRILDPYFTTKSGGTGLGLALCEKIIRQHGGNLDFRCTDDGTVFRITMPIEVGNADASENESP